MTAEPKLVLAGRPVLEFQPAVDLATGRLLGFEALIRWDHPTKGHIPPHVLLPWAEANDDIASLNAWILTEACRQAQEWPSGIQVAVNCSIVQLRRGEACEAVARALEESGLNPDRLTIEVTERAIADDQAARDLRAVSALGVHLAVDDVGTSWSTLQPLRRLDVEIVKIDRAFITSLEAREGMNRAIVEAVIHVSHTLAMSTVAEGVETAQQVAILREFGADVGQGYFFDPPLAANDARALAMAEPRPVYDLTGQAPSQPAMARALTVIDGQGADTAPEVALSPAAKRAPAVAATKAGAAAATAAAVTAAGSDPVESVSLGPDGESDSAEVRGTAPTAKGDGNSSSTSRSSKSKGGQRGGPAGAGGRGANGRAANGRGSNARGGKGRANPSRRGRGSGPHSGQGKAAEAG
jgi:EAL domain-containing protein (putative c-di-GMP-specific phosphodiesterase class I)